MPSKRAFSADSSTERFADGLTIQPYKVECIVALATGLDRLGNGLSCVAIVCETAISLPLNCSIKRPYNAAMGKGANRLQQMRRYS
jgi:hypothetical protein